MNGWVDFQSDPDEIWGLLGRLEGDTVFDIGANGGLLAEVFAQNFQEVIAVEPCAESYARLWDTPANVTPVFCAVSDRKGTVDLVEAERAIGLGELVTGDSLPAPWGPAVGARTVPCVTVDELTGRFGLPDLIKIDTEGHELHVIEGASETLASDPRLVIEIHSAHNGEQILARIPDLERHGHPAYKPGSYHDLNHYWLVRA